MIFDTHAHYDDEAFEEDRDEVLDLMKSNEIEYIVNVGASIQSSRRSVQLSEEYDFIYCAVGVHPSETAQLNEDNFETLKSWLTNPKVVAVGEIGLDYYWDTPERTIQKEWFYRQLLLAIDHDMPVIIHSRDAAADTLEIMKKAYCYAQENNKQFTGVIHCFSYGIEMAKEFLDMGFYLGIGGVVTFKNAKKVKEVVEFAPLERIVLETDCPYLAPVPHRGERNQSTYIQHVAIEIADIKGVTSQEVIQIANKNAKHLYGMNKVQEEKRK